MSRLSDLYKSMETLRKEGVSTNDLEQKVGELEEEIIKKEILPVVTETIEPALKQVQRELVLVVEYHPGEPISVALSRKAKINEIIGAKTLTQQKDTAEGPKYTKAKSVGFSVKFPDGTIFCEDKAVDTFIKSLKKIGLKRIAADENCPMHSQYKVVDTRERTDQPKTQRYVDGYYIFIKISNGDKIADLEIISSRFGIGLHIE